MSLKKFSILQVINVNFSLFNMGYCIVVHMLAVIVLMLPMNLPFLALAILFSAVIASALYCLVWQSLRQDRLTKVIYHTDGSFTLLYNNKIANKLTLDLNKTYLSSLIMILPFKSEAKKYSITLWRDSVSYTDWRLLHTLVHQIAGADTPDDSRFATKL